MSSQYPHTIEVQSTTNSTTDANGGIIPGTGGILQIGCRYRPNTSAKVIKNVDGQTVEFRGTCYVRKGDLTIANGDLIRVPGFIDEWTPILQIHKAFLRTRIIL